MYSYNINLRFDYTFDKEDSVRRRHSSRAGGALGLKEKERDPDDKWT